MTVMSLEYSDKDHFKLYIVPEGIEPYSEEHMAHQKVLLRDLKRCKVTRDEIKQIYKFWHADRGPHDCVMQLRQS